MLTVHYASTATLTATLRNLAGAAVTGATVTLTITSDSGVPLTECDGESMTDVGGGAYTYTIASSLLPVVDHTYTAKITAAKSGETRSAEVAILVAHDRN